MTWQSVSTALIREQIYDVDPSNYSYTDERIEEVFIRCSYMLTKDVTFENSYTINVDNRTITPDPVNDEGFIVLSSMKSACSILMGEWKTAINSSVKVIDGPSTIDYTQVAKNLKDMYDNCLDQFEKLKFTHRVGAGSVGEAILTPYSPGSDFYNYRGDYRCR